MSRTPFTYFTLKYYESYIWEQHTHEREQEKREDPTSHYNFCNGCMACMLWPRMVQKEYLALTKMEKRNLAYKLYLRQRGFMYVRKVMTLRLYLPRQRKLHTELIYSPYHVGGFFLKLPRIGQWKVKK